MRRPFWTLALVLPILILTACGSATFSPSTPQPGAIVHAILFYSPTCPHCQKVITEDLPPLLEQYGDQLQIIGVNISVPGGQTLFQAANDLLAVPEEVRGAVPFLVVGETYLVGSADIPNRFPGIVEEGLRHEGIDWPDIPGLAEAIASIPPTPTGGAPAPTEASPSPIETPVDMTMLDRFLLDPAGNSLSVVVLAGMLASLVAVGFRLTRSAPYHPVSWKTWAVPILAVAGMLVSGYLTYVEASGALAVCGPVGDCNTVQQSEYARLFGVVPMGLVGLVGYLAILLTWLAARRLHDRSADGASVALLALTAFGTIFSAILTFLEPFVIGATCIWCLSSAVLMTCLMLLASGPGVAALNRLMGEEEDKLGELTDTSVPPPPAD